MLKKLSLILLAASVGFILNCGKGIQTGPSSGDSFIGLQDLFPRGLPSTIVSVAPAENATGVSTTAEIRVQFTTDMNPSTITPATITVIDENNNAVAGTVTYDAATRTATFVPASPLGDNVTYTVTLSRGILDTAGNALPYTVQYRFTSVDAANVPAPEISLMPGSYTGSRSAVISCSETGAMISYTVDGSVPTRTTGTLTAAPATVAVTSPMTLRAMAYLDPQTKNDSAVTSAVYIISTAAPVFTPASGTYSSDIAVSLSSATGGAVIFYTTDGSTPTTSSTPYSSPIPVAGDGTVMTIRAMATSLGMAPSSVMTETYTIDYDQASSPTFTPMGGVHAFDQWVTIICSTPGASIYYTTDGSMPTTSSALYSGPINVAGHNTTMTVRAMAAAPGYSDSAIAAETYTISYPPAPSPTFNPMGGTYSSDITVILSNWPAGSVIYYTTDGSAPTTSSAVYSAPIPVSGNGTTMTIRAMGTATGYSASAISQETYTINYSQASTPIMNPTTNTFSSDQAVDITCSTPGSTIYYTTDGSAPTTSSAVYSAAIPVTGNGTTTIRAFATAPGYTDSAIASETYTITYPPADPVVFTPLGGSYTTDTDVTLSCATPGHTIYYTTDGSVPTTSSNLYSAAIPVTGNGTTMTIRAMATAPGYSESAATGETYTINWLQVTVPGFNFPSGSSFNVSPQTITITTPTALATVHYSTDGGLTWYTGTPLTSMATVNISAEGATVIHTYASAAIMLDSTTTTATYYIDTTAPQVNSVTIGGQIAEGARDVESFPLIQVTFNEDMNPSSVTTNTGGSNACSGSLQVSSDGFSSCIPILADPTTVDNRTFSMTPSTSFISGTVLRIRINTAAADAAGNATIGYTTPNGFASEVGSNLDTSFGSGAGYIITEVAPAGGYDDETTAILARNDGTILVAGYCDNSDATGNYDYLMARYLSDGTPDPAFSGGGESYYHTGAEIYAQDVAIQPGTGRIILAGGTGSGFHVAGFDSNGVSDSGFGISGGYSTIDVSQTEFGSTHSNDAMAMAIDPSTDKIYVAGYANSSMTLNDFALIRFNAGGTVDSGFAGNGIATTNFYSMANEEAQALALQSDGKIVVAGTAYNGARNVFAVARFNDDGTLDTTFGPSLDGKAVADFSGCSAFAQAVAIYPDGSIMLAGHACNQIALVKLTSAGILDASFNGGGMRLIPYLQAGNMDRAFSMVLQKNGKILLAGSSGNGSNNDAYVARFLTDGTPDTTFAASGVFFYLPGSGNDAATDLKQQPEDGRIVVTGSFYNGPSAFDIFVLRLY